ncbi:MAG: hypothetical protein AB7L91_03210 [Dehalococcoidia bacterium]
MTGFAVTVVVRMAMGGEPVRVRFEFRVDVKLAAYLLLGVTLHVSGLSPLMSP